MNESNGSSAATLATTEPTRLVTWTPSFVTSVDSAVARVEEKREFYKRVMRKDEHFGIIPGTDKPTLYKPGAELLLANMGLNAEFHDEGTPILDVTGKDHNGEPFILYRRECRIYKQLGPSEHERMLVAKASGACNSWEKKYRYRNSERVCPSCGKNAIIKGKSEYGGGWVCFKKKDGCGAKFKDHDPAIAQQEVGKVPNPEIFDLDNTLLKMADKRALVAATLVATGCSDIFTQDVEDLGEDEHYYEPEPPADAPPPRNVTPPKAQPHPLNNQEQSVTLAEIKDLFDRARAAGKIEEPTLGAWLLREFAHQGFKQGQRLKTDQAARAKESLQQMLSAPAA